MTLAVKLTPVTGYDFRNARPVLGGALNQVTLAESDIISAGISISEDADLYGSSNVQRIAQRGKQSIVIDDRDGAYDVRARYGAHGWRNAEVDVYFNTVPVWSGYVSEAVADWRTARVDLKCRGWIGRLAQTEIPAGGGYTLGALLQQIGSAALGARWIGGEITESALSIIGPSRPAPAERYLSPILQAAGVVLVERAGFVSAVDAGASAATPVIIRATDALEGRIRVRWQEQIAWNQCRHRPRGAEDDVVELAGESITSGPGLYRARYGVREITINTSSMAAGDAARIARKLVLNTSAPRERVDITLPISPALPITQRVYLQITASAGPRTPFAITGQYAVVARKIDLLRRSQSIRLREMRLGDAGYINTAADAAFPGTEFAEAQQ